MSERKWTPAQQSAITDEGGSLLVSAAAGSGKTAVLVERAVRMVTREKDPVPADRLLIVTFTNAAAQELRTRIALRIEQELRNRPQDTVLRRQRVLLRRAPICTIDAFCQQLVKENFAAMNLPPDVAVGDSALLEQLSREALADTMEKMYEDENFARFAELYGRARSDREAENAILGLFGFTRTLPAPEMQMRRFAQMYQSDEPLKETAWGKELLAYGKESCGAMLRLIHSAIDAVEYEDTLAAYMPALQDDLAQIQALQEAVEQGNWNEAVLRTQEWKFVSFKPVRGADGVAKENIKLLRDQVKAICERLRKYCFVCTEEEFEQDRRESSGYISALVRAAEMYDEVFMQAKLREKVLDFSDFEQLALALLQAEDGGRTSLAEKVSGRYDVVMVDEYQDTNELQDALYSCLAKPEGDNLFYVGDVKQSIYRFRKANPGLFLAKKRQWAPYQEGTHPAVLTLGHNFRSGVGVVGGVNDLFGLLMSRELGDITYDESEKLIQGSQGGEEEGLELRVLRGKEVMMEPRYVAQRIQRMVRDGYLVREDGTLRPVVYGDFCVLLRARARMPEFLAALEELNIPAVADSSDEILQTPEVLPVTAALAAIDNPGDDVNMAAALLGPLFRFTADEVTELRANTPQGSLWGALLQSDLPKAKEFIKEISFYRAMATEVSAGRLCEELVVRSGYLSAVGAMESGYSRKETLLRFIGWAGEISAGGRGGLSGFVQFIQSGKGPTPPTAGSVPGHVNILTIHKSKGLEFPVCFLADTARPFNNMDLNSRVQMHAEMGVGLYLRRGHTLYATLPALAIRHRISQETLGEEMRVLYVALTRAKEKIVITMTEPEPEKMLATSAAYLGGELPDAAMLSMKRSFAEWIISAALCHPDADPFMQMAGGYILPQIEAEGRFVMSVEEVEQQEVQEQEAYQLTAEPDREEVERLIEIFSKTAPRAALQQVPVKMSVSAIAKKKGGELRQRPSFMYAAGLTAAEKGTAQHTFMQYANFAAAEKNVQAEVQRLYKEGYLTETDMAAVDVEGLGVFLHSALAQRMSKADALYREYDFITAVSAGLVQPDLPAELAKEEVLIQGIADAVLVRDGKVEIADYKTDRNATPEQLVQRYTVQLALYRQAVQKRIGLPVSKLTIWAFALGEEIDVPLD